MQTRLNKLVNECQEIKLQHQAAALSSLANGISEALNNAQQKASFGELFQKNMAVAKQKSDEMALAKAEMENKIGSISNIQIPSLINSFDIAKPSDLNELFNTSDQREIDLIDKYRSDLKPIIRHNNKFTLNSRTLSALPALAQLARNRNFPINELTFETNIPTPKEDNNLLTSFMSTFYSTQDTNASNLGELLAQLKCVSFSGFALNEKTVETLLKAKNYMGDRHAIEKIDFSDIEIRNPGIFKAMIGPLTTTIYFEKTRLSQSATDYLISIIKSNMNSKIIINKINIADLYNLFINLFDQLNNLNKVLPEQITNLYELFKKINAIFPALISEEQQKTLNNLDSQILTTPIKHLCIGALARVKSSDEKNLLALNLVKKHQILDIDYESLILDNSFYTYLQFTKIIASFDSTITELYVNFKILKNKLDEARKFSTTPESEEILKNRFQLWNLLQFNKVIASFNDTINIQGANLYLLKNEIDDAEVFCVTNESKEVLEKCKQQFYDKLCDTDPFSAIAIGKIYKLDLTRAYQAYNEELKNKINSSKKFPTDELLYIRDLLNEITAIPTLEALKISCITTILTGAKKAESKKEIILACELLKKLPPHQQFVGQTNDLIIELTKKRIGTLVTDHPQISTLPILIKNTNVATDLDAINAELYDYIVKFSLFNKIFMKKLIEDIKSIQDDISLLRITFENNKKIRPASLLPLPEEDGNQPHLPSAPSLNDNDDGGAIAAASAPPLNEEEDEDDLPAIEAEDAAFHEEFSKPIPGLLANLSLLAMKIDLNTMPADEIDKLFPKVPKQEGLRGTAASVPLRS